MCLIAGYTKENRGQLLNIVMKLEDEDFSFGSITMEKSENSLMEDEILLSQKDNQHLFFFSCDTRRKENFVAEDK